MHMIDAIYYERSFKLTTTSWFQVLWRTRYASVPFFRYHIASRQALVLVMSTVTGLLIVISSSCAG